MYLKFSSVSWTDLNRGQGFFRVSGRSGTRFLSGLSTSWSDLDAGPGLSFLRWTSGRMDGPFYGRIRTADHDYQILSGRTDGRSAFKLNTIAIFQNRFMFNFI